MAKAICVISMVQSISGPKLLVGYTVATDIPITNFGADFKANTAVSVATNLANLKTKVVADCANQGVTLVSTDVIVFGGPA